MNISELNKVGGIIHDREANMKTEKAKRHGYLVRIDSIEQSNIVVVGAEALQHAYEKSNDFNASTGTVVYGRDSIGKTIGFRYDVIEDGGIVGGKRIFSNRVLVDGEIMWEVPPAYVIGIKEQDGWRSVGRYIIGKKAKKPPLFVSAFLVAPEPEDDPSAIIIEWPNEHDLPVGTKFGIQPNASSTYNFANKAGEEVVVIPIDYVLFQYNS